jgi:hypothetical protein
MYCGNSQRINPNQQIKISPSLIAWQKLFNQRISNGSLFASTQLRLLKLNTLNSIKAKLITQPLDFALFNGNVYNNIVNNETYSTSLEVAFGVCDQISNTGKKIVNDYLNIYLKGIISLEEPTHCTLYLYNDLIALFEIWRNRDYDEYKRCVEQIDIITGLHFNSEKDTKFNDYLSLLINNCAKEKHNMIKTLIQYVKSVAAYFTHPIVKLELEKKPVEVKKDPTEVKIRLDDYKVQGLKDLCSKNQLNTSKCRLRADYVNLLLSNNIGV